MTRDEFISSAKERGYTLEETRSALNKFRSDGNFFDGEQPPNPNYRVLAHGADSVGSSTNRDIADEVLDRDEVDSITNRAWLSSTYGTEYTDEMAETANKTRYPDLETPAQANKSDQVVLNYELPKALSKERTISKWGEEGSFLRRFGSAITMGAIPLKDEPQERTLPYRSEIPELSLNKAEQNIYDTLIGLTLIQENPKYKGSGTRFGIGAITEQAYPEKTKQRKVEAEHDRQLFISNLQSQKKRAEGFWTGEIPDSVKNSLASQFASAPGEIMTMGVYLIPYVGAPIGAAMTAGRYYNEAYNESIDEGFQEQDAHNIATGYTAIFGTAGFVVDKLTAGVGKIGRFKTLRQALTDQKLIIAGASTAAVNEGITETAESAYLQYQTTGEIDWGRARTEGLVAAFTGLLGGEVFGQINVAQKNKIEKSLIEKGIDSDTAKAIMSANTEEEARAIYGKWLDGYVAQHGERVNRVLNPEESFEVDPASKPMTKGDFRLFGRDENGNVLDNQAIIERAKEAIEPELQGIFIQAAINPTDENVKMYNKAAEAFILQEDTVSRQEEVDEETDTDIEPIDEVAPEPLVEVEPAVEPTVEPVVEPTMEEVFPVDEVIEPETVAETFSDVLNNFSDIELIEYSASIIGLGATLSPEVAKEIQTRFNTEYLYSTFWKQVSEKAAIITENTKQTPINFEDQVGNQDEVNIDIYNRGVDLFEDALLKLQESIFNKGEEHWNGIADKYIDAATRNARERGETAPVMEKQVIIKMLRQRNSMDRMNQMRQKLANAVYAGDESKVTQILNDNNFMLDRPFARRILTATTAFSESRQARNLANAPQYNKPEESFEQPTIIIEKEDVAPSNEQTLGVVLTGKDNQVAKNEVGILKSLGVNDNAIRTITGIDNETGVSHIPGLQIAYDYDQPISEEKTEGGNPVEGLGLKYITTARSDDTIIEVFQDAAGQLVYFKKRKIKSSVDDTDIIIPESGILANEDEGARMSVYLIDSTPLEQSTIAKETFAGRHVTTKNGLIGIQTLGLQFDGIAQNERQSVYEELLANLEKVIPSKFLYELDDFNYRELQALAKKEGIKANQSKEDLQRKLEKLGYGIFGVKKELVINFTHINASVVNIPDEAIPDITVEQFYNIVRKEYLTMVSKRFKNNPIETIKNTGILNANRFESDEAELRFDEILKENQGWNTTEVIFGATQEEIDGQWKDTLEFISNVLPNGEGFQIFNAIQDLVPEINVLLRRGKLVMRMWSQEQWDSFFAGKREPVAFIHWNGFGREIIVNPDVKPGFDRLQAALHELGHAIDFKYFRSTKGLVFNDGAKIWSDYVKKSLKEKGNDFDTRIRFVTTAGYKPSLYVPEYFAETWSHWVLIKSGLLPMIDDKTDIQFIDPESLEVMEEVMSNIGKIKDIDAIRESRRSETQDFNEPLSTDKFEFSEPLPGIGMKNVFGIDEPRMQEVAKPIPVQKVLARADAIYFDYVTGLNLDELQLTDAEGEIAMRYLAQLQGIETGLDPVNVEDVPQSVIDLLETPQGWNTIFPEIADNLNEISETLNIPFKPIAGYYFPLRHSYSDSDVSAETIIDLIESSLGAVKQRKGKFEGVIKDPAEQLRRYLKDYSRLKAAAEAVQVQRESVRENYPSIAEGVVEATTSPKPTPNQEIKNQQIKNLKEVEDFAETLGIPKTALTDFEFWRLVNQYEKDGQGQQLPSFEVFAQFMPESKVKEFIKEYGSDWANIVDPYMVVQTMDNLTDQLSQGRIYGSNSEVWERVVLAADRAKQIEVQNKEQQVEILRPIKRNKENLNKLNDLLHNALIADKALVRMMFRDMPNASKISKILKVDLETASIVEWHRNKIVDYKKGLHLHEDMRSDLSLIDKELRSEFHQLYNAALEGVATEQEVLKLMTYAPDVKPGDDLSTEDGQKVELKRNIFRIASRWFFEREAINSGNFFSYFDSMSNMAIKGNMYTDVIALIDEWANYLESIGQNSNARWWRTKIKNNIKGDLFKFEDYVLDVVSTAVEIGAKKAAGKEFTGSGLDPIRAINAKDLKKNMVLAMNIIQKAAIARSLGGNLAWSLITQPSSLAFTIMKTGFMKTGQALYRVGRGKEGDIIDESAVASLKGFRKSGDGLFGSFEATGTWSDIGTRRGKRAILRDKLGLLQSGIESYLTSVSVVAGREYAKDTLGLTPDQSRMHGNFVGATTQTMYDQVTRNTALNSKFMRSSHPFQSYVFTAFSNGLDILGVLGIKRSAKQRFLIELGRWMVASNLWWLLWSLFFGDDLLKALFNPTIKKSTPGSFVPLFGKDLDIAISKAIPWMDDKSWQGDLPHEQFAKNTQKVFMNAVNNEENWERELAIYFNNYVFPFAGVPGAVPLNNFIKTYDARYNNYAYETAKGDVYRKMRTDGNTPWFGGVMFGIKGADEYTPFSFSNKFIKEK